MILFPGQSGQVNLFCKITSINEVILKKSHSVDQAKQDFDSCSRRSKQRY